MPGEPPGTPAATCEDAVPGSPAAVVPLSPKACASLRGAFARNDSALLAGGAAPRGLALVPHLGGASSSLAARAMAAEAAAAAAQAEAASLRDELACQEASACAARLRAAAAESEAARVSCQLARAQAGAFVAATAAARAEAAERRSRELAAALLTSEDLRRAAELGRRAAERAAVAQEQRGAALQAQLERQRGVIAQLAESRGAAFEERFSLRLEAQKFSRELAQAQRAAAHLQQALEQQRAALGLACSKAAEEGERVAAERWQGRVSTLRKQLSETRRKLHLAAEAEAAARAELTAERLLLEQAHTALSADHAVLRQASNELAAELAVLRRCAPTTAARAARLTLQRAASGGSPRSGGSSGGSSPRSSSGAGSRGSSRPSSPASPSSPCLRPPPGSVACAAD